MMYKYSSLQLSTLATPLSTRQKIMSCNRLLKTECNNVVGATLLPIVNSIEQYCRA